MAVVFVLILLVFIVFFPDWYRNGKTLRGAPYEGMDGDVIARVLRMAEIKENDIVYDLGSGEGRVVIGAALKGAKTVGIEIDRLRILYSRLWIFVLGLRKKVKIVRGDIFKEDISEATVVVTYLLPETHEKLKSKLKDELKKGTKVVAVGFEYKGWKCLTSDPRGGNYGGVYVYIV